MLLTILIQILCDLVCLFVSLQCWRTEKEPHYKRFFLINAIAFFSLTLSDVYYNILFRVLHYDISQSIDLTTTITLFVFEFGQFYCWRLLSKCQSYKLISYKNSPYIVFAVIMVITLNYYFITSSSLSLFEKIYQSISIFVDMFIWLYAIICLSRTRSLPVALLSLGCLTLVSSSLTICCLFLFDMSKIVSAEWLHVLWTFGTFLMAIGFILFLKEKNFSYCSDNSIQVKSCSLLSTASIFVSLIGFSFIFLLHFTNGEAKGIQSMLWVFPIALVFTMIISVLFGNWFSKTIFLPINMYLKRIESFNLGQMEDKSTVYPYNTYEFDLLGKFIDDAFEKVSNALAQEVRIAAQVAHDMRSPLIAVDSFFQLIEKKLDEPEKVFGKRAVSRLNDIAWSLLSKYKKKDENHEIVEDNYVFLSSCIQEILAEKRMEYTKENIEFEFSADSDNIFNIVHLNAVNLKRALSNLINNAVNSGTALRRDSQISSITM